MKTVFRYTIGRRLFPRITFEPEVVEITLIDGRPREATLDGAPMTLRSAFTHEPKPATPALEKKHGIECQVFQYGTCNC